MVIAVRALVKAEDAAAPADGADKQGCSMNEVNEATPGGGRGIWRDGTTIAKKIGKRALLEELGNIRVAGEGI